MGTHRIFSRPMPALDAVDGSPPPPESDLLLSRRSKSWAQAVTIGRDIAKPVFQLHGVDSAGSVVTRRQLRRAQSLPFFEPARVIDRCRVHAPAPATGAGERSGRELQLGENRGNKLRNCRMNVHRALDPRVGGLGVHDVENAVDGLVAADAEDGGAREFGGCRRPRGSS